MLSATWLHGSAVELIDSWPRTFQESVSRSVDTGFNPADVRYRDIEGAGGKALFQFRPSTPVIVTDKRQQLTKVFVLFEADGATIETLSIHDGRDLVYMTSPGASGDHSGTLDGKNTFRVKQPVPVKLGLVMTLWVVFAPAGSVVPSGRGMKFTPPGTIEFVAAGFDFEDA
jgi:hypothetical protein